MIKEIPIESLNEAIEVLREMARTYREKIDISNCPLCSFARYNCDECPWTWITGKNCRSFNADIRRYPEYHREEADARAKQIQEWIDKINKELEER